MLSNLVWVDGKGIEFGLDGIEVHEHEIRAVLASEDRYALESVNEAVRTAMLCDCGLAGWAFPAEAVSHAGTLDRSQRHV